MAIAESFNNAKAKSEPMENPQWIPRNIVGNALHEQKIQCSICIQQIVRGEAYTVCNGSHPHLFHSKCLYLWFKNGNFCPLCKTRFDFNQPPPWWYVIVLNFILFNYVFIIKARNPSKFYTVNYFYSET